MTSNTVYQTNDRDMANAMIAMAALNARVGTAWAASQMMERKKTPGREMEVEKMLAALNLTDAEQVRVLDEQLGVDWYGVTRRLADYLEVRRNGWR